MRPFTKGQNALGAAWMPGDGVGQVLLGLEDPHVEDMTRVDAGNSGFRV